MKRVLILLVLSQVRQLLEASVAKDPKMPSIFSNGETARCFNVWTATLDGWSLDRKGASRDPGAALARACLWDALGVGACVVPAGSDPNDAATLPPGLTEPWQQVGRYVDQGVRN